MCVYTYMLSLAGEHLLVQTCFMFVPIIILFPLYYYLLFVIVLLLSVLGKRRRHPEGRGALHCGWSTLGKM